MLIALAARVDAAPGADPIDLAIRYADILTGARTEAAGEATADGDDEDDDEDDDEASEAAERVAQFDDNEGDGAAGRDLVELAGELGEIDLVPKQPPDGAADGDPLAEPDEADAASLAAVGDDGRDVPDALPADAGSGALAMLDAELDPGDPIAEVDAADAAAPAGAAEVYEQSMRRRRPSRWGRLDVGVAWRSRWSEPMHSPPNHTSELWLVATWRR